jgi:tetratricopeptide (TPR) repeat protein
MLADRRLGVLAVGLALALLWPPSRLWADGAGDDGEPSKTPGFWEETLDPHGQAVRRLVARASELIGRDTRESRAEARELLAQAIELDPRAVLPRWELARLHEQDGEFEACARHLRVVARTKPDYQPPHSMREAPMLLDLRLAECLASNMEFAEAADRLRRILARGVTEEARVHAYLAQVEMARGRLEAAGFALEQARRLRPHAAGYLFLAAVWLDRAGRPGASRQELRGALARDPQLRSIHAPAFRYFPPADEHYTLALAYAVQGERHRAAIHLRHYLSTPRPETWDDRAREHLEEILSEGLPLALTVQGSASIDEDAARAALEAARPALEACLSETPSALYLARMTTFVRESPAASSGAPQPGPRVLAEHVFLTPASALEEAIACAETILGRLDLPHPRGSAGQYATLELPLLAP